MKTPAKEVEPTRWVQEKERNAKISSTFLGIEDHGVLTFSLHLEGDGWGQAFGGHSCEGKFLSEAVRKILEVLEVDSWEKLPGRHVRMVGTNSKVSRIGHILKDKWYDITEHSAQYSAKHKDKT
jgi:hypothetical protein